VVLYELICGRPPFEGKNYNAVLYSIVANPATPIMDLGAGDEDLWAILERALRKDPDRRWYSMRDFGEALATWLEDRDVHEDISGTSLQTTWLQWRRDGADQLESAPPQALSIDEVPSAFPPPPNLPQMQRSRVATVRKRRTGISAAAYVGLALALALLVYVLLRALSPREIVVQNSPVPSTAATTPARSEPASEFSVRAKSELSTEPAVPASALPVAGEDEAEDARSALPSAQQPQARPPRAPRRHPQPRPRSGIVADDPYGGGLKDPFK
jgi:serine/threonine protein kinase